MRDILLDADLQRGENMDLIEKIKNCYDFNTLYQLNEDLLKAGITIQPTNGDKMIMCRLEGDRPVTDHIVDDYIFIGHKNILDHEIPARLLECVVEFVTRHKLVKEVHPDWQKNHSTYGVFINNEQTMNTVQEIVLDEAAEGKILDAIVNYLDNKNV